MVPQPLTKGILLKQKDIEEGAKFGNLRKFKKSYCLFVFKIQSDKRKKISLNLFINMNMDVNRKCFGKTELQGEEGVKTS